MLYFENALKALSFDIFGKLIFTNMVLNDPKHLTLLIFVVNDQTIIFTSCQSHDTFLSDRDVYIHDRWLNIIMRYVRIGPKMLNQTRIGKTKKHKKIGFPFFSNNRGIIYSFFFYKTKRKVRHQSILHTY